MKRFLVNAAIVAALLSGGMAFDFWNANAQQRDDPAVLFIKEDDLYAGAEALCKSENRPTLICQQKANDYVNQIKAEFVSSPSCSGLSIGGGRTLPATTDEVQKLYLRAGWSFLPDFDDDDRIHGWFLISREGDSFAGKDSLPDMVRKICSIMKGRGGNVLR